MSDFLLVTQSATAVTPVAQRYTLDDAATQTGVHPDLLRYYCRAGLLGIESVPENEVEPVLGDAALYEVQRIEHYRRYHHVNLRALPVLLRLVRETERLTERLTQRRP